MRPAAALCLAACLTAVGLPPTHAHAQTCATWSIAPVGPTNPNRSEPALAYDAVRRVTVLFGGTISTSNGTVTLTDTWEFDGSVWRQINVTGPTVAPNGMVYDVARARMVLLTQTGETWEYDGAAWTQRTIPAPGNRTRSVIAYDTVNNRTVLHAGRRLFPQTGDLTDTWVYNGVGWTEIFPQTVPPARAAPAGVFDARRGRIVMYGGILNANPSVRSETWEFDGTDWTFIGTTPTLPRALHTMFYDARTGFPVIPPSGQSGSFQTLIYENGQWREVATAGELVSTATLSASAYDIARGRALMFGGSARTEAFIFSADFLGLATAPQPAHVDQGDPATFFVTAFSAVPFSYQWRRNGVNLPGATSAGVIIPNAQAANAGQYDVVMTSICGTVVSPAAPLTVRPVCTGDLNNDSTVNFLDLAILLDRFTQNCPLP